MRCSLKMAPKRRADNGKAKRDEEEGTMERDTHFLRQPSLVKGNCQHMSDYKNDFNFEIQL